MFVVHVKIYYVGNPEGWKGKEGIRKHPLLSINKVRFPKEDTHESCWQLLKEDFELRTKRGRSCKATWHTHSVTIDYVTQTGGIYHGELRIKTLGGII